MMLTIGSYSKKIGDEPEYFSLYIQDRTHLRLVHNGTKNEVWALYDEMYKSVIEFDQ